MTAGDSWELPLNKFFPNVGTPIDFPVTVLVRDSSHQFFQCRDCTAQLDASFGSIYHYPIAG